MTQSPPLAADVIASGIHDAKNGLFDALARIGVASRSIRGGQGDAALPALDEAEQAILASAERLSKLLSAYRLARHENPVSMLPVDVGALLEDVLQRVQARRAGDIVIESRCAFEGIWVCDRELVADCLVNALQNALHAARALIRLSVVEGDTGLTFEVADDGPGFPAELSEPARRAESGRSGIGLYIAQRIAHLHERRGKRGKLFLSNADAGGAVFRLTLP
jgi:signal transduction histidine kinase